MKRMDTLRTLQALDEQLQQDIEELQAKLHEAEDRRRCVQVTIAEVERMADNFVATPQKGSHKVELLTAITEILGDGPMHRQDIMDQVIQRGVYLSRGLNSLTPYLSRCEQFKNVGKGIWALNDDDAIPSYDELSDNVGAMAMNGPPMFTD